VSEGKFTSTEIAVVIAGVASLKEIARTETNRDNMPETLRHWTDGDFDALIGKLVMVFGMLGE
jgi:hypothetical protein